MASYFEDKYGDLFSPSIQIGSEYLPLNLSVAGIGTQDATDYFEAFSATAISDMFGGTSDTETETTTETSTTTASTDSTSITDFFSGNWFARSVIVILGFIFVAVGLNMFTGGQVAAIVQK